MKKEETKNEYIAKDDSQEEVITTSQAKPKRKYQKRAKRLHDGKPMTTEKEDYLSRFANAYDLISSSSSSEEENSDSDFDVKGFEETSEASDEDSENSSLVNSSQITESAPPSETSSYLSESHFERESQESIESSSEKKNNKKKTKTLIKVSQVSSYQESSLSKKKMAV